MGERVPRRAPSVGPAGWVLLPVLALIAVFLVDQAALPSADCDGVDDEATGLLQVLALLVTGGASLACLVASGLRLARLRRAGSRTAPAGIAICAAAVALVAVLIAAGGEVVIPFFVGGLIATGLCFLAAVACALLRRGPDRFGIVLPLYLTGMAVFLYPAVLILFAIGNSGLGC
jgi:hypothetical protein